MMSRYLTTSIFLIMLISCSEPITIQGFDNQTWINDKDGCNSNRQELVEILKKHRNALLGKDQDQIRDLLGKPDKHEIYKRGQRFYLYSIGPGSSCTNYNETKTFANLTLRYNALGRVHEVVFYK
jgi:outer membrane protein assembly factor BamE (lipoprotein component of BamABCDE complex)